LFQPAHFLRRSPRLFRQTFDLMESTRNPGNPRGRGAPGVHKIQDCDSALPRFLNRSNQTLFQGTTAFTGFPSGHFPHFILFKTSA
jgi:hypothetical protein